MYLWALYYFTVAVHVLVGGYSLRRGGNPHRWVATTLLGGFALQLVSGFVSGAHGVIAEGQEVSIDTATNCLTCSSLSFLALRYTIKKWLLAVVEAQAARLYLDGLVFGDDLLRVHYHFSEVVNILNIFEMALLASATLMYNRCRRRAFVGGRRRTPNHWVIAARGARVRAGNSRKDGEL